LGSFHANEAMKSSVVRDKAMMKKQKKHLPCMDDFTYNAIVPAMHRKKFCLRTLN